jgi:hypothetical protein
MQQDVLSSSLIDLTREIRNPQGVSFDPEKISLTGTYTDQLSAYRAKKLWTEALEVNFLLDTGHDFVMSVESDIEDACFRLNCEFVTACGRYAFWRLTHNQAPEVQYLIETAHIPNSESRHQEFLAAPDLRSVDDPSEPLIFRRLQRPSAGSGFGAWLRNALLRLAKLRP